MSQGLPVNHQIHYYSPDSDISIGDLHISNNSTFALQDTGTGNYTFFVSGTNSFKKIPKDMALQLISSATEIGKGIDPEKNTNITTTIKERTNNMAKKNKSKNKGILSNLFEVESAIAPSETDPIELPQDISLDQKVDKYLVRYEREAIPTSAVYDLDGQNDPPGGGPGTPPPSSGGPSIPGANHESINRTKKGLLESMLFEADEEPPADGGFGAPDGGAPPDPAADPAAADPAMPGTDKVAPVVDTPKMNLNSYCRAVARLCENYEALMNPKATIFNRAKEYVKVNYDEATAKMFEQVMEEQYGVRAETQQRDQRMAPPAAQAIYSGGGSSGG